MKRAGRGVVGAVLTVLALMFAGCGGSSGPAALSISTASLPGGTVNVAYSQTLAATGGTAPLSWTVSAGTLPAGLALSAAGVVSGTPTTAGTSTFTVMVTDSASPAVTATKAFSITIAPVTITTASLPAAITGTSYNQTLAVIGGTAPYSWAITAGALPAGLSLNGSTGLISGTPSVSGTFPITFTVTDATSATANLAVSLVVNVPGAPLTITTASLPAGTVGAAYSQTLAATGGTGAYTWSVFAGTLPVGLALNSATGVISGTPTTAGTSNVTFRVTDAATNTNNAVISITINPAAPAVPAAPTGVVATGGVNSVSISWPAVTGATSYRIYFSPTTGVTTANTQVTVPQPTVAVTSPYRHSRLTTTPTWLAANTPYFYIVTAVNANGESAPSAQATATTSAVDGVALYTASCSSVSCHGSLVSSSKHNRSATQIQTAINNNTGGMGFLSGLTAAQVQAISNVLVTGF